jgi:hypothetical protein
LLAIPLAWQVIHAALQFCRANFRRSLHLGEVADAIGIGALITIVLMAIKLQFPTWPLHPVAFPLAWSWPIDAMLPAITFT